MTVNLSVMYLMILNFIYASIQPLIVNWLITKTINEINVYKKKYLSSIASSLSFRYDASLELGYESV